MQAAWQWLTAPNPEFLIALLLGYIGGYHKAWRRHGRTKRGEACATSGE